MDQEREPSHCLAVIALGRLHYSAPGGRCVFPVIFAEILAESKQESSPGIRSGVQLLLGWEIVASAH
jgi:hypothetical protein